MGLKRKKPKQVRDNKETKMEPTKVTAETAPLYTVKILDLILSEQRLTNKLLKQALQT